MPVFRCSACLAKGIKSPREYLVYGENTHFREHLFKDYKIVVPTATDHASESVTAASQRITDITGWNQDVRILKRFRRPTVSTIEIDAGVLRVIYLNWVMAGNLFFILTELPSFQAFLEFVNSTANLLLPRSHYTIR